MPEYMITVRVPFTFDGNGESTLINVGLGYLLDAVAVKGLNGELADDVEIKIKKKKRQKETQ